MKYTSQKMLKRGIPILLFSLILISSVSALTNCSVSQISVTFEEGDTPPIEQIACQNQDPESSVQVNKIGSFFSTNPETPISISPNGTSNIQINFNPDYPPGTYDGALIFNDGSNLVPVSMTVEESSQSPSGIIVFPTNQVVTVNQGQEKTRQITITVPSDYPESITIQQVNFNPDVETIRFGDLSLGQVSPGNSVQIPVIFSGVDAQTGTYQTTTEILAIDSSGQIDLPDVALQLQVTAGTTPIGGGNLSRPSCALSSSTMNLNSTYSLTCSGVVANLDVQVPYSEYFQGVSAEITSGILTYVFKPVKYGVTNFVANFYYLNLPIFEPFVQNVTISASGTGLPGTTLKFIFTPKLDEVETDETTLIQIVDNSTGSVITGSQLYIDAVQVIPNGYSFPYEFDTTRTYEIRGIATGYNDLVETINFTRTIEIFLSPTTGDSNTVYTINTSINSSLFINGDKKDNPYVGSLNSGINEIRAIKEGYRDGFLNVSVEASPMATLVQAFEKNTNQIIKLNMNISWAVYYQKDEEQIEELLLQGEGDRIEFIPKKSGLYTIKDSQGNKIGGVYKIEGWFWSWWYLSVPVVVIFIGLMIWRSRNSDDETPTSQQPSWANNPYAGQVDMGQGEE